MEWILEKCSPDGKLKEQKHGDHCSIKRRKEKEETEISRSGRGRHGQHAHFPIAPPSVPVILRIVTKTLN